MIWESYKKSKQPIVNSVYIDFYHWLTEKGTSQLPLNTKVFLQGVEWDSNSSPTIYYIHLQENLDKKTLENFEIDARQMVRLLSQERNDAVISLVEREPFKTIKVRIDSTTKLQVYEQHIEEDF